MVSAVVRGAHRQRPGQAGQRDTAQQLRQILLGACRQGERAPQGGWRNVKPGQRGGQRRNGCRQVEHGLHVCGIGSGPICQGGIWAVGAAGCAGVRWRFNRAGVQQHRALQRHTCGQGGGLRRPGWPLIRRFRRRKEAGRQRWQAQQGGGAGAQVWVGFLRQKAQQIGTPNCSQGHQARSALRAAVQAVAGGWAGITQPPLCPCGW